MKKSVVMLIAVCCMTTFSSCSKFAFTDAQKAKLAKLVVQEIYDNGGADEVTKAIDELVAENKLTPEQGEIVKVAAKKCYDKFFEKLDEKAAGTSKAVEPVEPVEAIDDIKPITNNVTK